VSCNGRTTPANQANSISNSANEFIHFTRDTTLLNKVLILYADSADRFGFTFEIKNADGKLFTKVESLDGNEPSSEKLSNKILAYYPEFYIQHFKATDINEHLYAVQIGDQVKSIKKGKYMELLTLQDYILRFFCTTDKLNPLRDRPSEDASLVPVEDYEELSFRCVEIVGEWVKVICNDDCEGCPENNKTVKGWIKWSDNGKLILNQYFTC
jgi:hypothetical protein